jgi:hypothetical protein
VPRRLCNCRGAAHARNPNPINRFTKAIATGLDGKRTLATVASSCQMNKPAMYEGNLAASFNQASSYH